MSELSKHRQYDTLASSVDFAFTQKMKNVYTCMPGVVVGDYDAGRRTVTVRGALNVITSDLDQQLRSHRRDVIRNVPIVYPHAGPYHIQFPLSAGDSVLLLYAQRGMDYWKKSHRVADPTVRLFSEVDAICIPGFGIVGEHPPAGSGLVVGVDGGPSIELTESGITISGNVTINGDLTVNGAFSNP